MLRLPVMPEQPSEPTSSPRTESPSTSAPPRRRVWPRRVARAVGLGLMLAVIFAVVDGWKAFGHRAQGERRARMERSPQWKDGHFENPQPIHNDAWGTVSGMFEPAAQGSPALPLPTITVEPQRFATPPATGLRITWLGHSSTLVEIDGYRVLTDPIWSERASPRPG